MFIGQGLRVDALREALDACLLSPEEVRAAAARGLADDDPLFGENAGADEDRGDDGSDDGSDEEDD